jgi:alpha-1,3-mannosyltransferase
MFMWWGLIPPVLDGIRAAYSTRFYQEIDWHCYAAFGQAVWNGQRNYQEMLCDYGYNVYPAAMSWLYAGIAAVTGGGAVDRILVIHVVLWTLISALAFRTYAPHMDRGWWLFSVLPLVVQSPFRAAISRVTNDTWVAAFTVALHALIQAGHLKSTTVVFAVLLSLKMNSMLLAPAILYVYWSYLRSVRRIAMHMGAGATIMIALASPFLAAHPREYLGLTYDFSRLFEHRVNMAWGFLGYDSCHRSFFICQLFFRNKQTETRCVMRQHSVPHC